MMKIHTTQNLSNLAGQGKLSSINSVSLSELRFTRNHISESEPQEDSFAKNVSFGKKKPDAKNIKLIISKLKDLKVGNIKEKAAPEVKRGDKFLKSKAFDVMLGLAENEPVIQAAMAALICIGLRPLTIMALPNKKDKQNNMYAASHSISSGMIGLISSIIIAQPFKMSTKYVMKNMYKDLKAEALERLNPHLDLKSIVDANGNRKPVEEWLDKAGNKFIRDFKDVEKIPMLKPFNEISAESFKQFGADVDWAAYKGKSFNEVFTRDGKSLYDALDWNRIGIIVKKEGSGDARILLRDLDRGFLENVIRDAEESSAWKKLDLESVYKNGKVQDFRKWKALDGKQWKLDLNEAHISSPYDTADYIPRITGKVREVAKDGTKYTVYLKNGKNGELGTEVTKELMEADRCNEVHDKILTWLPDILARVPMGMATIALIPMVLSKVFHIEKNRPVAATAAAAPAVAPATAAAAPSFKAKGNNAVITQNIKADTPSDSDSQDGVNNDTVKQNNPSFKANNGGPAAVETQSKFGKFLEKWVARPLAKAYGKPLYESEVLSKVSKFLAKMPGKMSTHMATLGALLTSSVYINQTLHKKELDPDRRRTLAVNQAFCFVIPTAMAYLVDNALNDWIKKKEYRYAGLKEQAIATARMEGKDTKYIEGLQEGLGKKLKGVRILAGLATFTLIYRYIAPVLITPAANWVGDKLNARKKAKLAAAEAENEPIRRTLPAVDEKEEVKTAVHAAA